MSVDAGTAGLIGAAIGGASTMVGVIISSWLQREDERVKWIRDKKLEAYSNVIRNLYRLKYKFSKITAEGNVILAQEDQKEWFTDFATLLESLNLLPLFANESFAKVLFDKAVTLQNGFDNFIHGNYRPSVKGERKGPPLGELDSLLNEVRHFALIELGISEKQLKTNENG